MPYNCDPVGPSAGQSGHTFTAFISVRQTFSNMTFGVSWLMLAR